MSIALLMLAALVPAGGPDELKAKIDALSRIEYDDRKPHAFTCYPLSAPGFPLVEVNAREQLRHVYDSSSLDGFRKDKPVERASAWLKRRGIALVFVPVPKMTEVYAEHFVDRSDIAPHVRKLVRDIPEAVDLWPVFRASHFWNLYNTADRHWSPEGQRLGAIEVAKRLHFSREQITIKRQPYSVLNQRPTPLGEMPEQEAWHLLTDEQKQLAERVQPRFCDKVEENPASPVLMTGNSYVPNFDSRLAVEAGLRVRTHWSPAQTTESFADFIRQPELLNGVKVIVWVTTTCHMTCFKPLPDEVR